MKHKLFLLLSAILVISCSDNSVDPIDGKDYSKTSGIYSITSTYGTGTTFHIEYAEIDSLDKFEKIGLSFDSGFWLSAPDHFVSVEYNLYLVATLSNLFFVDTKTNKLVKTIPINSSPIVESSVSPGLISFLTYKDKYCIVVIRDNVYLVNLLSREIEYKIFEGKNIDANLQIQKAELSFDKQYLYVITMIVNPGLPQRLLKVNLANGAIKKIADFTYDRGIDIELGLSKDYVICYDGINMFKYSVNSDGLIETKIYDEYLTLHPFYRFNDENFLIALNAYPTHSFYTLDCENLVFEKYYEIDSAIGVYFQQLKDVLIGICVKQGFEIIDIQKKGKKFFFSNPGSINIIIKEVL